MSDPAALENRLGYKFRDEALLRLALTHPSVSPEGGVPAPHNQRLEFLGDAVLRLIQSRMLYEKFPGSNEGWLSKSRALLESKTALAERARSLGVGAHLILSRSEEMQGGRERGSALADAFEALAGAIFLDGGFDAAREFILREFGAAFGELETIPIIENPKSDLQELLQSHSPELPQYRTVSCTGPSHNRVFECAVHHGGVELARGSGKNKKAAESEAALAALKKLRPEK
ncbi:MAG: ribonuclease III [Limisphaerales bacterium]